MKQELIYDYLIPNSIYEHKKEIVRHQKKLDEIKTGKSRRNISLFQQDDAKQTLMIKKNGFNIRQQEQQFNIYKENTKMFFKLFNISSNNNFSSSPQRSQRGTIQLQNKSQNQIIQQDISLSDDIVSDLQQFEKSSQLEQVLADQTNKVNISNNACGQTVPIPERQTLNVLNKSRNSVSPTCQMMNQSKAQQNQVSINTSQKQIDFLEKVYKENLILHQRLIEMDSVIKKKKFDKFHEKQQEYKSRIQKFQVDQDTLKVKMKYGTYIDKISLQPLNNKSRDELSKKKNIKLSLSPERNQGESNNLVQKTEQATNVRGNGSYVQDENQKETDSYPISFFTEIDERQNESSKKQNIFSGKNNLKQKSIEQYKYKSTSPHQVSKQNEIQRKKSFQLQVIVSPNQRSNLANSNHSRKTNNYTIQRSNTINNQDQNNSLIQNAKRENSISNIKNKQNFQTQPDSHSKLKYQTIHQTQNLDAQFKNYFHKNVRSVSAKRNQSILRNNLINNQKNLSNIESKINLSNLSSVKHKTDSTRNIYKQNHNFNIHNNNAQNKQNIPYILRNNQNMSHNNSLMSQNLNNSNNNSIKYEYQNNSQLRNFSSLKSNSQISSKSQTRRNSQIQNNFMKDISLKSNSNNISKKASNEKSENQQFKILTHILLQGSNDLRDKEVKKKQNLYTNQPQKMNYVNISPNSQQNQQNFRRRIKTVHHDDRKQESIQQQKYISKIQRVKLFPLSQVNEEDHFQQTLYGEKSNKQNPIDISQKQDNDQLQQIC